MRRWLGLLLVLAGCGEAPPPGTSSDGAAADAAALALLDGAPATAGDSARTPALDAASACSAGARPTGVSSGALLVGGLRRTYTLSVPAGHDGRTPLALVFGWHGMSWTGATFRTSIAVEDSAAGAAIFVYPDGLALPNGQSGWDLSPTGGDVALFDALYAELTSSYCVDRARVFGFGRSFGGFFQNTLGCARADRLRGQAALSGGGPPAGCSGRVPTWLYHAMDDATVAFASGVASRDHWLAAGGCSAATTPALPSPPCVAYQGCAAAVVWCASQAGGHWPPAWTGPAVWRFFASL